MNAREVADRIVADLRAVDEPTTAGLRHVRKQYSKELRSAAGESVFDVARSVHGHVAYRWIAYELIANHKKAFATLDRPRLEALGEGMDSWHAVDTFARTLSGPAWRDGLIGDAVIHEWACSSDRWWRRAALVSTIAFNIRSHGGTGDVDRTLAVCRLLVAD